MTSTIKWSITPEKTEIEITTNQQLTLTTTKKITEETNDIEDNENAEKQNNIEDNSDEDTEDSDIEDSKEDYEDDQVLSGFKCDICNTKGQGLYSLYGIGGIAGNGHGCGRIYCEDCFGDLEEKTAGKCECGTELGFFS